MLFKLNSNTPPVASLLVLEKLKDAVQLKVEWAKGNLLQPSKVSLSFLFCCFVSSAIALQGHLSQTVDSIKLLRGDAVSSRTSIIAQNVAQTLTFFVIFLYSRSFYILYFLLIFY